MLKTYLKIAWRNLAKNKLYTGINILGLSLGLSACLLISLYVFNETTYDAFHLKSDKIARVTMEYKLANEVNKIAVTGSKVGPEFNRQFPEIENFTRTYLSERVIKLGGKSFLEERVLFADSSFFKMFSFKLIQGDPASVLLRPNQIVLTESMAKKYFGNENPMSQTILVSGENRIVSGVCEDAPKNSQIKFDFVTQFSNVGRMATTERWWSASWITYFLLNNGSDIELIEQKMNDYMATDAVKQATTPDAGGYLKYHLEPLLEVHLKSDLAGLEPNGNQTYVYILIVITLLILLIAIANYTNLATAQSTLRSGEIGIRKVMGANKKQVFFQFIAEASTVTFIATSFALLLSVFFIPYFNAITGQDFVRSEFFQPLIIGLLLVFGVVVSFLSGLYPALVLSNTKVLNILKKGFSTTGGKNFLRKGIIVGQFAISVFLIVFTIIILQQINFIKTKHLGYEKDHVLVLPINSEIRENFQSIKDALLQINGVSSVTAAYETPEFVEWSDGLTAIDENGEHDVSVKAMPIDLDFTKALGMKILAGRDFIRNDFEMMDTINAENDIYREPYLINETLAKRIGWTPEQAIGKTIAKRVDGPVVGVVEDFHFSSLHEPVGPLLMILSRNLSRKYMLKISDENVTGTLSQIETIWKTRIPEQPFEYQFLDENYNALYKNEQRSAVLFSIAAGLSVVLACLGLFGLVAFSTVQRTKEIGIRKVLGAGIGNIILLISKNFLVLVSIAIVLASPLAYWASDTWLQNFSYRIEPQAYIFVIAGLITLLVTFITIGFNSYRASIINPVKSLRAE